jgi:REP element-mobilizing transposase RayT
MFGQPYKSLRLPEYDYSSPGLYYVTICTQKRVEFFGAVKDGQMILNEWGKIVLDQWLWLKEQYEYIDLDDFIVMPNHFHGVLSIVSDYADNGNVNHIPNFGLSVPVPVPVPVGAGRDLRLRGRGDSGDSRIKIKPLSELIGAFKTTSSKIIHLNGLLEFKWQRSFYEHIVRDENDLMRIKNYICNNPANWQKDRNN